MGESDTGQNRQGNSTKQQPNSSAYEVYARALADSDGLGIADSSHLHSLFQSLSKDLGPLNQSLKAMGKKPVTTIALEISRDEQDSIDKYLETGDEKFMALLQIKWV